MSVEERVLERIRPDDTAVRRIESVVAHLLERIEEEIPRITDLPIVPKLVGSVAKGTYLRDPDIDVFIMFPQQADEGEMRGMGLGIGKAVVEGEERYAEHPYVHGEFEGFQVDIVPCFVIEDTSRMRTSVDRTPFHTNFVLANMDEAERDQVRLLKRFMKGIGTYGAEARVEGFSGYLNELLVMRYGSFREVLEAASLWRKGEVISIVEGEGRFNDPLTFHDPVDPMRNVASALSLDAMATFIAASKDYLRKEDERFFFPAPLETWTDERIRDRLRDRGTGLSVIRLDRPDLIDDNLYPQVRRSLEGLCRMLVSKGFTVLDRSYHIASEVLLMVETECPILPGVMRHEGPPAWVPNASEFREKWQAHGPFIDGGKWQVHIPRPHRTVEGTVRANIPSIAWGSSFRGAPGLEVLDGVEALRRGWGWALTAHLDRRMAWKR